MLTATANEIITESLEILGVLGEGEDPNSDQFSSSLRTLNMLVKTWQADGLHLFAVQDLFLFPVAGQNTYTLSATTTDRITTSYTTTTATIDVSAGTPFFLVESAEGAEIGGNVGVQNGLSIDWYIINDLSIPGQIDLGMGLEADLEAGTQIYFYNEQVLTKPLKLLEAYSYYDQSQASIIVDVISRREFDELSVVSTTGEINQIYFNPQKSYANLKVYPVPQSDSNILKLVTQRSLTETSTVADNVDYPEEWLLPLAFNLAKMLAPKYGIPAMDYQRIAMSAAELYQMARGFDQEHETSVYFKPDYRWDIR